MFAVTARPSGPRIQRLALFAPVDPLVATIAERLGLGRPTTAQIGLGRFFDHRAVWRNYGCLAVDFVWSIRCWSNSRSCHS